MATGSGTNDSCTAEQTSSQNFEEEDIAAAVSLLEFCANLEDYTPTVSKLYMYVMVLFGWVPFYPRTHASSSRYLGTRLVWRASPFTRGRRKGWSFR